MMIYISMLLIFLPLVLITAITPYITRKTESFGITIPSDVYQHPTIAEYRKKYAFQSGLAGVLILVILGIAAGFTTDFLWTILYTVGIFVYILVAFIIYFQFHKKMKQLKEKENWKSKKKEVVAVDLSFYNKKLTYSNGWFLLPFIITVFSLLWTFWNYDRMPEKLPMHYTLDGVVTDWADKSYRTVLLFPFIQLFMLGLFVFINIIIARSKQQMDPANPEELIKQNIIFRRRWSLFIIISGTMMVLLFTLPQVSFVYPIDPFIFFIITMVVVGVIVIGAGVLSIVTGQGGSRVNVTNRKTGEIMNRDDDRYWKLGVFYFNPDDPAVWVEKRFGSGWTNNFARPTSWIFLILILLIPILIAVFAS